MIFFCTWSFEEVVLPGPSSWWRWQQRISVILFSIIDLPYTCLSLRQTATTLIIKLNIYLWSEKFSVYTLYYSLSGLKLTELTVKLIFNGFKSKIITNRLHACFLLSQLYTVQSSLCLLGLKLCLCWPLLWPKMEVFTIQNWPVEKRTWPWSSQITFHRKRPELKDNQNQPEIDPRIIGVYPKCGGPELISWSFRSGCESGAGRSLDDIYSSSSARQCAGHSWGQRREKSQWITNKHIRGAGPWTQHWLPEEAFAFTGR